MRFDHHTDIEWRNEGRARLAQQLQPSSLINADTDEIRGKLERYAKLERSWNFWAERL